MSRERCRDFVLQWEGVVKRLPLILVCAASLLAVLEVPAEGIPRVSTDRAEALKVPAGDPEDPRRGGSGERKKDLLLDAAVVSAAVCAYVLVIPDTRRRIFREASIRKVWENFKYPFWSAREGGRRDHNGFWINCVGHPLSFAALGLYLKERGYGNLEAMAFTQAVNVAWEYVIEGSMWLPSSKDLIADLCGSLAAIYVMAPLSDLGEERLEAGDRRWGNVLLFYLNPFKKINRLLFGRRQNSAAFYLLPARGGFLCGWRWAG